MCECGARTDDEAVAGQVLEVGIPRDLAEGDDDSQVWKRDDFCVEMIGAGGDFLGQGLVPGRCAANCGRDVAIAETQTVVGMTRRRDVGEPGAVQGRHQKITRCPDTIPGEDATGAICAMSSGREAQDQHSSSRVAEARHGLAPVFIVAVRGFLFSSYRLTISAEPIATPARHDCVRDRFQRAH